LPLVDVKRVLQLAIDDAANGFVVVTQAGGRIFGAVVDNVFQEIVVKPMSSKLRHIAMFSGMTILGDGSVIMVIDPNVLAQSLGRAVPSPSEVSSNSAEHEPKPRQDTVWLVIFRVASERPKAVPLSLVSRIEEIDCRNIEIADGRHIVKYRDALIPLLGFDVQVRIEKKHTQPVLVLSEQGRSVGLVIDEIVDIVEERLDVKIGGERPGVLGYALIRGAATEIVDVRFFLEASGSLGRAA
jgi:two-component system chemotaxis sensor kinase CheA